MDPVHLWVDPSEVRRLAEQLMRPHCDADEDLAESESDGVSAPPEAEIPVIESSPSADGITGFRDWMRGRFAAREIFILDGAGTVVFEENPHGRLHFLARGLALASGRPDFAAGNVHVNLGIGATLEIIPANTPRGPLVLGAVLAESLPPEAIREVAAALFEAAAV